MRIGGKLMGGRLVVVVFSSEEAEVGGGYEYAATGLELAAEDMADSTGRAATPRPC